MTFVRVAEGAVALAERRRRRTGEDMHPRDDPAHGSGQRGGSLPLAQEGARGHQVDQQRLLVDRSDVCLLHGLGELARGLCPEPGGDGLRRYSTAKGSGSVSASFELLRFAGLWCITHAPSFFQGVGIP